jgi:tetratricopeptide (TPR) repeat protein
MSRLAQLKTFLEESPNDAFLLFALAKEYENVDDTTQAQHFYEHLVTTQPDYVGTYYHLGKLYERLQKPDNALETYKKGMNIAQTANDRHAFSELAAAKMDLQDDDEFS